MLKTDNLTRVERIEILMSLLSIDTPKKSVDKNDIVDEIYQIASTNDKIVLLKNKEIIQWIFGDHSFPLPNKKIKGVEKKRLEDAWGCKMASIIDHNFSGNQWTTLVGERIGKETYILAKNKEIWKPIKKQGYQPDLESEDFTVEIKTGTYYTSGTAHEKVLGVPVKYSEVVEIYGKPLKILCIAGAEKICREQYHIFGDTNCDKTKQIFLSVFKLFDFEYVSCTEILRSLVKK